MLATKTCNIINEEIQEGQDHALQYLAEVALEQTLFQHSTHTIEI